MVVIQAAGGLGNQMQQYALYREFLSLGRDARLDVSWFQDEQTQNNVYAGRKLELSYFVDLPYTPCTRQEKEMLLGGNGLFSRTLCRVRNKIAPGSVRIFRETGMYHPEIFDREDCYFIGYWACEKYYADILGRLRELFRFPEGADPRNAECIAQMEQEESVGIHLRRGDYLDPVNAELFGGICTEDYYEGAIRAVRERCGKPHFYLFSDDPAYAAEHYRGEEYTVADWNSGAESLQDIRLMSHCRHNICANSTFSFWGARLNGHRDKIMIRPTVHKNTQSFDPEEMARLWPGWAFADSNGRLYGLDGSRDG